MELEFSKVTKMMTTYVRDTGLGIKEIDLKKLFRFFG